MNSKVTDRLEVMGLIMTPIKLIRMHRYVTKSIENHRKSYIEIQAQDKNTRDAGITGEDMYHMGAEHALTRLKLGFLLTYSEREETNRAAEEMGF